MSSVTPSPSDPMRHLMLQFLTWIDLAPRSYGQTMVAWRSSFPRLTAWEGALEARLIRIDSPGAAAFHQARVVLTPAGASLLMSHSQAVA